jgi:ATP-dependent RNA helicase SUPV3L1/SUV3
VAAQIAGLADADRGRLNALGVRIGRVSVFLPMLLKPAATRLRCLLWAVAAGRSLPALPPPGLTSLALDDGSPADFWRVAGFGLYGRRAVRLDILERVAAEARRLAASGPFGAEATLLALLGCSKADLAPVLEGLGYRTESEGETTRFRAAARDPAAKPAKSRRRDRRIAAKRTDSPFARLRELTLG